MQSPHRIAARVIRSLALASLLACGSEDGPAAPSSGNPRILTVSPSRAVAGQSVILLGNDFGNDSSRVSVTIGGVPAELLSFSQSAVEVLVPAEVEAGDVAILLTIRAGGQALSTLTVLPPGPVFAGLSAGGGFTCGIIQGQGAFCWGSGTRGQLGVGSDLNHSALPLAVVGGASFLAVSASRLHACALDAAGAAFCWGQNGSSQLGDGSSSPRFVATPVAGGLRFSSITAGSFHTCALARNGEAYCWGENRLGQLGAGDTAMSLEPRLVTGGVRFSALSAGGSHTCGLADSGELYCWGDNRHGELGDGSLTPSAVPRPIAGGLAFTAVSAGRPPAASSTFAGGHTCALAVGGAVYCWGFNSDGQLGDGSETDSPAPVPVSSDAIFRAISAGSLYTCGVTNEGLGLCWGANDSGQLGGGLTNPGSSVPVPVLGRLRFETIAASSASKGVLIAGRPHTCGLTAAGTAFCWGRNDSGQLGSGDIGTQSVPLPVVQP
jgi:hypothetical protein